MGGLQFVLYGNLSAVFRDYFTPLINSKRLGSWKRTIRNLDGPPGAAFCPPHDVVREGGRANFVVFKHGIESR
jgi:hypothetical protein